MDQKQSWNDNESEMEVVVARRKRAHQSTEEELSDATHLKLTRKRILTNQRRKFRHSENQTQ